jgi:hypothetical protein
MIDGGIEFDTAICQPQGEVELEELAGLGYSAGADLNLFVTQGSREEGLLGSTHHRNIVWSLDQRRGCR